MNKLTREEALRRWKSAKVTKKAMVDKMQKMLYEDTNYVQARSLRDLMSCNERISDIFIIHFMLLLYYHQQLQQSLKAALVLFFFGNIENFIDESAIVFKGLIIIAESEICSHNLWV